jgi:A/G-specific adenine glycosylase
MCAAQAQGIAADLPAKAPKTPKPTRRGTAYVVERADGALLVETRPPKGLLGGMPGLPTTDWSDAPADAPPTHAEWQARGTVRHTFTHFHLDLTVLRAVVPVGTQPLRGAFVPGFDPATFPTVMHKAWVCATKGDLFS